MKAKRLTALALAALMAASTTSVALALDTGKGQDMGFFDNTNYRGQLYMKDEDGYIVPANDGDFAPGDSIYLQLDWNESARSADLKRYNAYADWNVGKSWVEDVEIVYAKGDVITGENTSTVYKLSGTPVPGWGNAQYTTYKTGDAALADLKAQMKADTTNYNLAVEESKKAFTELTPKGSGWFVSKDGKLYYYDVAKDALTAENYTEIEYYLDSASQKVEQTAGLFDAVPSGGYIGTFNGNATVYKTAADALTAAGFKMKTIGTDAEVTSVWVSSTDAQAGYGTFATGTGDSLEDKTSEWGAQSIWVKNNKFILNSKVTSLSADEMVKALGAIESDHTFVKSETKQDYKYFAQKNGTVSESELFILSSNTSLAGYKKDGTIYTEAEATGKLTAATSGYYTQGAASNGAQVYTEGERNTAATNDVNSKIEALTLSNFTTANASTFSGTPTGSFHPSVQHTTGYTYWVKIDTKDSVTTKDIDVVGSISVGTTKSNANKWPSLSMGVTLTNTDNANKGDYTDREDDVYIEPGERAVVSFADDASDEFTVEFGDDAYFVFNARGQGKLNLAYNTKYDRDFAYDYDDANIDFINFEGEPTTNRTGTLYIYADEDSYIYEVTSKGAKKINGAYYDDDEEAWVIRTRNLTSYAISDKKLKTVDQMDNGSSSSSGSNSGSTSGSGSNNGKPNPDTGR